MTLIDPSEPIIDLTPLQEEIASKVSQDALEEALSAKASTDSVTSLATLVSSKPDQTSVATFVASQFGMHIETPNPHPQYFLAADLEQALAGKADIPTGLTPVVEDPSSSPTVETLRTKIIELLTALRNRGILSSGLVRDITQFSALTYTIVNSGDYSYYQNAYTMAALNDGNTESGMMVSNSNKVFVQLQFANPVFINRMSFWNGQFNQAVPPNYGATLAGQYNAVGPIAIYAGHVTSEGTALYQGSLDPAPRGEQQKDLTTTAALDTPTDQITVVLTQCGDINTSAGSTSLRELQIFGYAA